MKELVIKLIGVKGSGKTTITRVIQKALEEYDVTVLTVADKDLNKKRGHHNLDHCVESLKERVYVKIETENPNSQEVTLPHKHGVKKENKHEDAV